MTCQHIKIRTWVFEDTQQPSGLWSCVDCGLKFEPITQRPVTEPHKRVGLTDEEMYLAIRPLFKTDALAQAALQISKDEYRAIEAKIKGQP